MKIVDSIWFNSTGGSIGVIFGEDEVTGRKKAYIGNTVNRKVTSETDDAYYISKNGNELSLTMAKHFVELLGDEE